MRAIIFDMDGLMIDSERVYWAVGREIAREFGKEASDQTLGRMMGRSPLDSVALFAQDLGLTTPPQELLDMREARVMGILKRGVAPMPGLMEVLADLKPRFKLGIATSAKRYIVDTIIAGLKIGHYFDAIQTSDDVRQGKPNPEIYLKAVAKLSAAPVETIVLEDSSNGALAGKRAGAYVIAVPSQFTRDQDFGFADYVAPNLLDAAAHISKLEASRRAP